MQLVPLSEYAQSRFEYNGIGSCSLFHFLFFFFLFYPYRHEKLEETVNGLLSAE